MHRYLFRGQFFFSRGVFPGRLEAIAPGMGFAPRMCRPVVPSSTRVLDEAERAHYWSALCDLWKAQSTYFPGSHPVAVTRSTIHLLRTHSYVAALKTDGVRFVLMLTRRPDGQPLALMIDRSRTMYEVQVCALSHFFDGTLLDGELVWDRSGTALHFLVFDVVAVASEHVAHRSFGERLQIIHDIVMVPWPDMSVEEMNTHVRDERKISLRQTSPTVRMLPKSCTKIANVRDVWEARGASSFRNDGLLFTRTDVGMPMGRTEHMLKWKEHHTIDIIVQGAECVLARTRTGNRPLVDCVSCIEAVRVEANELSIEGQIVECCITGWDASSGTLSLFPMRIRYDKDVCNSATTVAATLENVREDITIEDIEGLAGASNFALDPKACGDADRAHKKRVRFDGGQPTRCHAPSALPDAHG